MLECTDVDKNSTAFPGPNARIISGVDVGDGTSMTEEELKVFIAEDLGIVMLIAKPKPISKYLNGCTFKFLRALSRNLKPVRL